MKRMMARGLVGRRSGSALEGTPTTKREDHLDHSFELFCFFGFRVMVYEDGELSLHVWESVLRAKLQSKCGPH
jgi:hypothetical protein